MLGGCGETPAAAPKAKAETPARPQTQTPRDVDSLLAPIALYPDSLLAQILMCAGDPASVTKLDGWLKANATLKGTALQDAAVAAGFEPSFVALVLFPKVVASMAGKIDWTTLVGQIFAADKATVFNSIQKLRKQAQSVGQLKSTPQQQVEHQTTSGGEDVIVIEPTNPQIIYVPQYNPTTVYTTAPPPAPAATTTTVVVHEDDDSADAAVAGMIGFTAGIAIGAAVNNSYYYGPYGWHGGAYMYNDAWDDYYDHREDAREDWQDHREDVMEERGDRRENTQENRTDRAETRNENRPESQARRDQAKSQAQQNRASGQSATAQSRGAGSSEARGTGGRTTTDRTGTSSNAFSGYSSGKSERAASSRGSASRGSSSRSRGGGGGRRR